MSEIRVAVADRKIALISYLTILLLLAISDSSCQQTRAKEPIRFKERSSPIDIKHAAIDLKFDWNDKQAHGTTTITLSPKTQTSTVALDAGMLTINSVVLLNGTNLKFEYDGGDEDGGLVIALDRQYQTQEELSLKIDYYTNWINHSDPNNIWGSFGKGIRFFEPTTTEPNKRKQIWSVGEPEGNRYWFPGYDAPNDLRTTEFKATVAKPLVAISNGVLVATKENNDGTRTFHWKADQPYANHLTSFVIGEYLDYEQKLQDIAMHSFGYPDEKDGTEASVVRLPDMMKFFSEFTGARYPHRSYSQIFVQDFGGWMSNMSSSTITENMVDDRGTHADFLYLWDITEGEALASQWFGNYLFVEDWSQVWLNKSFAHYLSGYYGENKNGLDEFLTYQLQPDHNTYLSDWNAGARQPVVNDKYDDVTVFTLSNHPYFHGASVLHMLRKHLGDDAWRKAIQLYVSQNANKLVSTDDFLMSVNEVSNDPMDWFFDQWLYKIGHPVFEVTKSYDQGAKELILTVKQTQKIDSKNKYDQNKFYKGKVEIEIDDRVETVWIEAKESTEIRIKSPTIPRLVNFDFQSTWIKEVQFDKSLDELLYQLEQSKDILARMDAMTKLTSIGNNDKTGRANKNKIAEMMRKVASGDSYWRLRLSALWQLQNLLKPSSATPFSWDQKTTDLLLTIIKNDSSWMRSNAINFLGKTGNPKYVSLYLTYLKDPSDRVVNMAAIALGKTKSPLAFDALVRLKDKPSWKNQSLISTMNGLRQLEDPRAMPLVIETLMNAEEAHWTLGTAVWDHRLAAANTLVALGNGADGYPLILNQFKEAMKEGDINDIFYNALQVSILADPRGQEVFDALRERFKDDENGITAIDQLEASFQNSIPKN